jgi:FkbM family methyltransferase
MVEGYGGSHDGYVFTAPIAQNVIHNSRHPVAVSGGENVIIWELQRRHTVINPCKQVVIVHEHAGAVRTRLGRVYGMRLGRCAPLIIPTETLETEDLTNWLRRTQEQEAESPGAFRRRRLEVQAFPSRRSDLPMLEIRGFDSLIEMYAPLVNEFYFIQVGANDGQSGDPIYHFVRRFRWRGITTEPQSEVFNQLQRNYETCDQVKLMNVAVAATRGKRKLYKLSFSDQRWATGLATFHRDRLEHAIRTGQVERQIDEERHKLPESREDYITTELVETMTFGALLDIDKPSELHLLQIDSEGHDAELIKQFDFARIKPKIIHYEHHAISDSDRNEASRKLEEAGYRLYRSYIDTVAVGPDVVERLRAHNGGAEIEFIDS